MGRPLAHVPDPAGDGHDSYARHFAGLFLDTFERLGVRPDRVYWMSEVYAAGEMDRFIRVALDRAGVVRDIYRRVANVRHPDEWHPLSVICENCGRIGTTIVTAWDGERVHYECRSDLVAWATGCGHAGDVSPFGGRAKLPFNVDWAAKWSLFGVTIEPNGKDLGTKGGARDRSEAIAREVFEREPPLNVVYEFLNIGGRKMSTSKGRGAAAHHIAEVLPPEQLRLLFLRPRYNQAIDFDPDGTDAIPRIFDESDRIAAAVAGHEVKGELPADPDRLFAASLVDPQADAAVGSRRLPSAVRSPGPAAPGPGRGSRRRLRDREGRAAHRRRAAPAARARGCSAGMAGELRPRFGQDRGAGGPAAGGPRADGRAARLPGGPGRCAGQCRLGRRRAAGGDLPRGAGARPEGRAGVCRRCMPPSWAGPAGRAPGRCWPRRTATSSSGGSERRPRPIRSPHDLAAVDPRRRRRRSRRPSHARASRRSRSTASWPRIPGGGSWRRAPTSCGPSATPATSSWARRCAAAGERRPTR